MRILVVLPALNLEVNDIGQALKWIAENGHEVVCLAARSNPSKSIHQSPSVSVHGNLRILRPWRNYESGARFPSVAAGLARRAIRAENFDVILCVQDFNFPLVRWYLSLSDLEIPVAVLLEQAWRAATSEIADTITQLAHRMQSLPHGPAFYRWVAQSADAIITCDPADVDRLGDLKTFNSKTEYVPWCTDPGWRRSKSDGEPGTGIFAGAFAPNKNPKELLSVARRLLEETPTNRFLLVTSRLPKSLRAQWGAELDGRFELESGLTLLEVAKLIERSQYGISAASVGGWGFIGNCWAMETPVVLLHPNGFVRAQDSTLKAWEFDSPSKAVAELLSDEGLSARIRRNGLRVFEENHSARAVGGRLLEVLKTMA